MSIPQQFNFAGKVEDNNGAEKQQKTIVDFSLDSLNVINNVNNGTSKNIEFL